MPYGFRKDGTKLGFQKGKLIGNKNPSWKGGLIKKNCIVCNAEFKVYPSNNKQKYCCYKCSIQRRGENLKEYYKTHPKIQRDRLLTKEQKNKISLALRGKKKSLEHRKNISKAKKGKPGLKGPLNPLWGGGRKYDYHGYVLIYKPNHPYTIRGFVKEHRFVMEEYIGRYLKSNEVVHHLNGIKDDNRIDNLTLCFPKTHHIFIKKLRDRIRELETQLESYITERVGE